MNTMFCFFSAMVVVITMMSSSLHAQADSRNDGGVSFRILTFERVKGMKVIQYMLKPGTAEGKEVSMHKNNFTGPYKASSRVLQFFLPADESGAKPRAVGKVSIPARLGKKILLIALPKDEKTYQFYPIADDIKRFKQGETKLINLSKVEVATKMNNKPFKVNANAVTSVPAISSKKEPHSYPVEFYFRENGKWMPLMSSAWQFEPDVRNFSFIYWDPKSKRIRIRTIRELPKVEVEDGSS